MRRDARSVVFEDISALLFFVCVLSQQLCLFLLAGLRESLLQSLTGLSVAVFVGMGGRFCVAGAEKNCELLNAHNFATRAAAASVCPSAVPGVFCRRRVFAAGAAAGLFKTSASWHSPRQKALGRLVTDLLYNVFGGC